MNRSRCLLGCTVMVIIIIIIINIFVYRHKALTTEAQGGPRNHVLGRVGRDPPPGNDTFEGGKYLGMPGLAQGQCSHRYSQRRCGLWLPVCCSNSLLLDRIACIDAVCWYGRSGVVCVSVGVRLLGTPVSRTKQLNRRRCRVRTKLVWVHTP